MTELKLCENCGHEKEHQRRHQKMIEQGYYLSMFFSIISIYAHDYKALLVSIMVCIMTIIEDKITNHWNIRDQICGCGGWKE